MTMLSYRCRLQLTFRQSCHPSQLCPPSCRQLASFPVLDEHCSYCELDVTDLCLSTLVASSASFASFALEVMLMRSQDGRGAS